ncbi:hypothetical protein HYS94_01960 [Candidatus Daviesbacteria bacterium]|nr:hypothetical protein [Candidatus Daviesbacteria bacterium]
MAIKYVPGEWLEACVDSHYPGTRHKGCPATAIATWLRRRGYVVTVQRTAIKTMAPGDLVWEAQVVWEDRH